MQVGLHADTLKYNIRSAKYKIGAEILQPHEIRSKP